MTFLFQIFRPNSGKTILFSFYGGGAAGDGGGEETKQNIHFFLHGQGKSINLTHPSCSRFPQNEGDSLGMSCTGLLQSVPPSTPPQMPATGTWVGIGPAKENPISYFAKRRKSFSRIAHTHTDFVTSRGKLLSRKLFSLGPRQLVALLLSGNHGLRSQVKQ